MIKIETIIKDKIVELEFKKPSKIIYANAFSLITKQDFYGAIDIIIENCYIENKSHKIDLKNDEPLKISIFEKLFSSVFSFKNVDVQTDYNGTIYKDEYEELKSKYEYITVVTINEDKTFFLRPLERKDYKEIFNKSIISPLNALTYIYQNLRIGGDDIYDNDDYFISCLMLSDYLLKYKNDQLKKK